MLEENIQVFKKCKFVIFVKIKKMKKWKNEKYF
jgi:hypothetical protein